MAKIVYSKKFYNNTKSSYKEPSTMHFNNNNQNFDKYGILQHSHISGTDTIGTSNLRLRNIKIDQTNQLGTSLMLTSMPEKTIKENISYSDCNQKRKKVLKIKTLISKLNNISPTTSEIQTTISNLETSLQTSQTDLDNCIEEFYTYYKNPDTNIETIPTSNILPLNYPPKDEEIFGDNLNSCKDSQEYHSSTTLNLDERKDRPVYGTKRALDMTGPRVFDFSKNVNETLPFNTYDSGYKVQDDFEYKNKENFNLLKNNKHNFMDLEGVSNMKKTVEVQSKSEYCNNFNCDMNVPHYKSLGESYGEYDKDCGTKSNFGVITQKLEKNPHVSEFAKNNIIGQNFSNVNQPSIFFRNKATFNNKRLIESKLNLNSLKKESHRNFIDNTNIFRTEVKDNLFKQQTDRIKNNLSHRGGF